MSDILAEATVAAAPRESELGRGVPQGLVRRCIRACIHFFSYHLFLKRNAVRWTKAAGFQLKVGPRVFHPRIFVTSQFFAGFLDGLDLGDLRVADVGTGSGILALAAARAGAAKVTAIDINPDAVATAAENARINGLSDRVEALRSDLLSALPEGPLFDVILSSPPSFPGEPRDMADRAWHAGPGYRDIAALFAQARLRLKPGGRMYVLFSSDSDLDLLGGLIAEAGFSATLAAEHSIGFETFPLYELRIRS